MAAIRGRSAVHVVPARVSARVLECLSQGSGRAALSVYRGRPVPPVLLPLPPAAGLGSQRRARLLHLHPRGESAGGGAGVAVQL